MVIDMIGVIMPGTIVTMPNIDRAPIIRATIIMAVHITTTVVPRATVGTGEDRMTLEEDIAEVVQGHLTTIQIQMIEAQRLKEIVRTTGARRFTVAPRIIRQDLSVSSKRRHNVSIRAAVPV
jgi:hypothetical protein